MFTRRVIIALTESDGRSWLDLAAFLALPVVLPLALLLDLIVAARSRATLMEAISATHARCAAGHVTELRRARVAHRCPSCGLASSPGTSPWAPCEACGSLAHGACVCGLPLLNPAADIARSR